MAEKATVRTVRPLSRVAGEATGGRTVAEAATVRKGRPLSRVAGVALREHLLRPGNGGRWPKRQRSETSAPSPKWQACIS